MWVFFQTCRYPMGKFRLSKRHGIIWIYFL
jgi:hypothetical protein